MSDFQHVTIIINPAAGQEEPVLSRINRVLTPQDISWSVAITRRAGDSTRLARDAVQQGADVVAAYGGDGTIAGVAGGLCEHDVPLVILPGGTGNAIAQKMGVPLQLEDALRILTDDAGTIKRQMLDIGRIQSHRTDAPPDASYFLLRTTIGLYNEMLNSATRDLKRQYGDIAYMIAGVRTLTDIDKTTFHLTIDGEEIRAAGHTCMVANITTIGGFASFDFAPDVDPADGLLDVFVFDAESEDILAAMQSHLATDLSQFPHHWTGREIRIETDEPRPAYTDGEPAHQTAVDIQVVPRAVTILVSDNQASED
jgi:YegS/Rv2252/BmrU family lipid kinase